MASLTGFGPFDTNSFTFDQRQLRGLPGLPMTFQIVYRLFLLNLLSKYPQRSDETFLRDDPQPHTMPVHTPCQSTTVNYLETYDPGAATPKSTYQALF